MITFSQKNELTLSDAVLQQGRKFGADKMAFFQFVPNSEKYSYLSKFKTLMFGSSANTKLDSISIETVNTALGSKLAWFSGFEWKDQTTFYVNDGINYYSYNTVSKKGTAICQLGENVENATFKSANENIAFTIENNLYLNNASGKKIANRGLDKNSQNYAAPMRIFATCPAGYKRWRPPQDNYHYNLAVNLDKYCREENFGGLTPTQ